MRRFLTMAVLALTLAVVTSASARAQIITSYYSPPPVVVAPAPVVTSYYCPPPTVVYTSPPVTTYYAPAPVVTYYAPPVTVYAPPTAVAVPGVVTTRTYRGFGIFRPRGLYTESYYSPGVVYYR